MYWQLTDTLNDISVTWRDCLFNETQQVSLGKNTRCDALAMAHIMREIADWCYEYIRDKVVVLSDRQFLGYRIYRLRQFRRLSIEELAGKVGIRPHTLAGIEAGKFSPKYEQVQAILFALDASLAIIPNEHPDAFAMHTASPSNDTF